MALTDAKYIGRIVHKGVSYQAEHQAIIAEDLFEQVRKILAANRLYTREHQATRFAMLRRLVYCGEGGSLVMPAWTNNHGREYRYYTCSARFGTPVILQGRIGRAGEPNITKPFPIGCTLKRSLPYGENRPNLLNPVEPPYADLHLRWCGEGGQR
jgi:hypothetical protein